MPQARWGCCYRGDKAFRPGNMAKPDREREPDRRTGLQGPHSSTAPSSDTAQHSTGRSPSLPRAPRPGGPATSGACKREGSPAHLRRQARPPAPGHSSRQEGAGPVSTPGLGTVLTSAQGSNPLLRELGQVQGYGKVKETARFMVSHQPHTLAEGTCLTADPGGSASQGPHRAGSERPLCPALCGPVSLAGAASLALVSESRPV